MKKKEDDDTLKEQSVLNTNIVIEKGSNAISLSSPAVNTGGRDATALRTSSMPGSSSALDLIKKKLQDSGTPTASPAPVSSAAATSESNGSKAVEVTVKGLQNENTKDKLKDINGDGTMSDSSSDSEDGETGPTKEECIIKFKVPLKFYFCFFKYSFFFLLCQVDLVFVVVHLSFPMRVPVSFLGFHLCILLIFFLLLLSSNALLFLFDATLKVASEKC